MSLLEPPGLDLPHARRPRPRTGAHRTNGKHTTNNHTHHSRTQDTHARPRAHSIACTWKHPHCRHLIHFCLTSQFHSLIPQRSREPSTSDQSPLTSTASIRPPNPTSSLCAKRTLLPNHAHAVQQTSFRPRSPATPALPRVPPLVPAPPLPPAHRPDPAPPPSPGLPPACSLPPSTGTLLCPSAPAGRCGGCPPPAACPWTS